MKVLVQRVSDAACIIDGVSTASIGQGFVCLVSFQEGETGDAIPWMAKKVANLRIFSDDEGKMNLSLKDVHGEVLSISQFTLEADANKGNRPSFIKALEPALAEKLYARFNAALSRQGVVVHTGQFGAAMKISLTNDGPVTIMLERTENDDT